MSPKFIITISVISLILCDIVVTKISETKQLQKTEVKTKQLQKTEVKTKIDNILNIPSTPKELFEEQVNKNKEKNQKVDTDKALRNFINAYKRPKWQTKMYYKAIKKYSKKYNIQEMVLASVIATECSFNPYAKHKVVKVNTRKGKVITRAIGAGVIFEIWEKELKRIGVKSKRELINIDNNVKSTAYIIFILKKRKQIKGSVSLEESALLRYYGVIRKNGRVIKTYSKKIYQKVHRFLVEV